MRSRRIGSAVWLTVPLLLAACADDFSGGAMLQAPSAAVASAVTFADIGAAIRGPSTLAASVVSSGLVNVAALAIGPDGSLWASTAKYSDEGTDALYRLTDSGPTAVLTDLHTPLGLLWIGEELYVSGASGVTAYGGFDGAVFTTERSVVSLPAGVGLVGQLASSPDGHLLLGISAPCDACDPELEQSGTILSFLPDGSDLRVFASELRAPVGLAFYPGTDVLFATLNQRDDLAESAPGDWLAVVTDGQSWLYPDCYGQGGTACALQPEPVAVLHAHAAVSGVAIVTDELGAEYASSALVAEWAKGDVMVVGIDPDDPSATGRSANLLLTGFDNPVAVITDGVGAVYVGDWGAGIVYRITAA